MKTLSIINQVEEFPTKHDNGFTQEEINTFLKEHPEVDRKRFEYNLMGSTGLIVEGDFVWFTDDIALAARCGVEDRDSNPFEWD